MMESLEKRRLFAAPGALDPGWGVGGTTLTALPGHTLGEPSVVLPQGDGAFLSSVQPRPKARTIERQYSLPSLIVTAQCRTLGNRRLCFHRAKLCINAIDRAGQSQDGEITALVSVASNITRHHKVYEIGGAMLIHYNADGTLDRHFGQAASC